MKDLAYEVNFDGIVGPTHTYGGLSYGNIPSQTNQYTSSNPREAALQGLQKMKFLADTYSLKQAVLPPHERPHLATLRRLGFTGSDTHILSEAFKFSPELLTACSSAAAMWTANAATVSPSADTRDQRVHFTAANLTTKFHRSLEPSATEKVLHTIFKAPEHFVHHTPLPAGPYFSDEGAANHSRFCKSYQHPGIHLFVFGRYAFKPNLASPKNYPARQTYEASAAIARLHGLDHANVIFAQQSPEAIDCGAFHNDLVSVSNRNLFFYHTQAFVDTAALIAEIKNKVQSTCKSGMIFLEVKPHEIPLKEAIDTYLFNSQIVSLPNQEMALIAPLECQANTCCRLYIENMLQNRSSPIKQVHYFDLKQSMRNGGGPACLRMRVVLTLKELAAVHPHVFLDEALYQKLTAWVCKHYREQLHVGDLADPHLLIEVHEALDELTKILQLGSIYSFQR